MTKLEEQLYWYQYMKRQLEGEIKRLQDMIQSFDDRMVGITKEYNDQNGR